MDIRIAISSLFIIGFLALSNVLKAQEAEISHIKEALRASSSNELSKYFYNTLELNLEGEKSNYSKTQGLAIFKDFFRKYPSSGFDYIHQGSSKEGLKYVIGKYQYDKGSFRVYMLLKQFKDTYYIDTIDFTKE